MLPVLMLLLLRMCPLGGHGSLPGCNSMRLPAPHPSPPPTTCFLPAAAWGALLARRLSQRGVLVFCLDYRNFPQVCAASAAAVTSVAFCTRPPLLQPTAAPPKCTTGPHRRFSSLRLPSAPGSSCLARPVPQGNARDMLHDVNTGIAWVLKHAVAFGGDGKTFHLVGQSAGGQLGALALISQVCA